MMNERIKLPAQEWLGYDPEKGDMHGYTFEQMREFAESIIKECAGLVEDYYDEDTKYLAGHIIRKHFGVK
jgi:hypothetical protein